MFGDACLWSIQGSGSRIQTQEERIYQVSRKPCSIAGEPEQNSDRGAEISEGAVLSEGTELSALETQYLMISSVCWVSHDTDLWWQQQLWILWPRATC